TQPLTSRGCAQQQARQLRHAKQLVAPVQSLLFLLTRLARGRVAAGLALDLARGQRRRQRGGVGRRGRRRRRARRRRRRPWRRVPRAPRGWEGPRPARRGWGGKGRPQQPPQRHGLAAGQQGPMEQRRPPPPPAPPLGVPGAESSPCRARPGWSAAVASWAPWL